MRRLLALGALAGLVWWVLSRRQGAPTSRVVVGFGDGSSRVLEPGSRERELLLAAAAAAL